MKKEERTIYYDGILGIEAYQFKGISHDILKTLLV